MFLSRILILPAIVAALAFAAAPAIANDDEARDEALEHLADHLLETIKEAHHHPGLLDHAFFESMDTFHHDDHVRLAFYRALPGINWYRNHDARHWVSDNHSHYYHDFMEANQVSVAVVVETGSEFVASTVAERVIASLPPHAVYANDPGYSDIVIVVRLSDMQPQYREKSRKPKSKKYKKEYRKKPPRDQQIHFANYTNVEERVSVALSYEFEMSAGAQRISLDRSSMTLRNNYSYGVDFQAFGPDGPVNGAPYPSKKVRKLMERDVEATRANIADKLIGMAAARVATKLNYDAIPLRSEMHKHRRRSSHR